MTIARRTFLKNVVTGSSLIAGAVPLGLAAERDRGSSGGVSSAPIVFLRTRTSLDDVFRHGMAAATDRNGRCRVSTRLLDPLEQTDPVFLGRLLVGLKGRRLVGLMEDAPYALFEATARTLGARSLFIGQHSWGGGRTDHSSHRLVTVPQCRGVSSVLAGALRVGDQGYSISETSLGSMRTPESADPLVITNSGHWAAVAGEMLATICRGRWQPAPAGRFQRARGKHEYGNSGSVVSFVIDA